VSVSVGTTVARCGRPSRFGRPTSMPWDELPLLRDAQDGLGMTVLAVDRPESWTH
jgi:hypothetical protein